MKLIDAFKQFLLEQKNPASPATVKNYLADIRKFVLWFEERFSKQFSPQEVSVKTVEEFKASISQAEGSAKSIERYVSTLRKFFRFLKLEGIIASDPFETQNQPQNDDPLHLKSFKNFLYVYNASTLTIKNYLIDIRQFFTWAQTVFDESASNEPLLSLISPAVIEEYKQRLLEENVYSPTSINRKLSSLRKYFAWAIEQGIVTANPFEVAQSHNNPLNLEAVLATDISGRILEKQPEHIEIPQQAYSAIPPVRLVQKSLSALDFLMDKIIVTPISQALNSARLFVWHAQGKPVFTRPSLTSALKLGQKAVRTTTNFPKEFYAPLKVSINEFPWYKKVIFHIRFTRPNWYRKYHSYAISHYFNLAVLFIFCVIIGAAMYSAFVNGGQKSPSLAAGPVSPLRILSFQGRLTDNLDNPITSARNLRFTIYSDSSASSSARLWEEVDNVGPDQDGIFSVLLGSNGSGGNASLCNGGNPPTSPPTGACGIPQSLFAQNAQLWLGVTVENGSELTPRQQLATVAYASNAETLQGLPPTTDSAWAAAGTNGNAVLALSSNGVVNIAGNANAVTVVQAASSQIKLTGNVTTLATNPGSNGNVQIIPDGSGWIDAQKPIFNSTLNSNLRAASNNASTSAGAVEVDGLFAVLATSSGQSAVTIDQDGIGPIISASHSGSPVFTVGAFGDTSIAGNTNISGNLTLNNSISGNVSSNIIPTQTLQFDLGSSTLMWRNIYAQNIFAPITGGTSGFWQLNSGAIAPANLTNDLLLGSTATASATFGFINVARGTPTATISAGTSIGAIYLTATGKLATTNDQNLNIGDAGTGNIVLSPVGGTGTVSVAGNLTVTTFTQQGGVVYQSGAAGQLAVNTAGTAGQCLISSGTGAPIWTACSSGANGVNYWTMVNGALSTANNTADLLVGGNSTASAKFAVLGINNNATVASISAQNANNNAVYVDAVNTAIQSVRNQNLTIGGNTTGNIFLTPLGGTSGLVTINGSLALSTFGNQGGVVYQSGANGQVSVNTPGANGQCLVSSGTGAPTWQTCATGANGVNYWALQNGALNTINNTADLLVGGVSTAAAHFSILGVNTNTTVASVSAQNANNSAIAIDAANNAIQTVRSQNLTIGGSATGNITISPLNGGTGSTLALNTNTIALGGTNTAITNTGSNTLTLNSGSTGNLQLFNANNFVTSTGSLQLQGNILLPVTGGTDGFWQLSNNVIASSNSINDLVVGGNSTASAKFHVYGATGNVTIGTTASPLAALDARATSATSPVASLSGNTSATTLIADQTGSGNIFSANQAGAARFVIANNGTLTSSQYTTAGGILYTNASGNFQQTPQGNNTQCLMGGATPTWSTCALGTNWWTVTNGTLFPINQTLDFLIGGTSTASAHFGILGVNNNAIIASISAQNAAGNAISLNTVTGQIQTANLQSLTLGGSTTGRITLSGLNSANNGITFQGYSVGILHADTNGTLTSSAVNLANSDVTGVLPLANGGTSANLTANPGGIVYSGNSALAISTPGTQNQVLISNGAGAPTFVSSINVNNVLLPVSGGTDGFWQLSNNVIAPSNLASDLAVGGSSTASAKFQVFSNGNATTSGTLTFNDANTIQTTNSQNFTLGGTTTGNITLNPLNSLAGGFVAPAANNVTDLGQAALNFRNVFATTYNSGANVGQTIANTSCINTVGGIVVSTGSCGTQNWWTMQNGLLYPINSTLDLAIGGTATTGAVFAVTGSTSTDATSYPTASVSATTGNFTGNGIILGGNGSIQSLRNNNLTIGGNTSGNITLSPLNGGTGSTVTVNALSTLLNGTLAVNQSGTAASKTSIDSSGNVLPGTNIGGANLGSPSLYWTNVYASAVNANAVFLPVTGGTDGFWQLSNNVIAPSNLANDLTIGGNSTASAAFQVFALGTNAGTATTSGNLSFRGKNSKVNLLNGANLGFYTSNGGDTGAGNPSLFIANAINGTAGSVGINTTSPTAFLDVAGTASVSGSLTFRAGAGSIQTTSSNPLTIGGATTGPIILSGLNGANNGITFQGYAAGIIHAATTGVLTSSAVNLASADVTGVLPLGNGGTNSSLTASNGGIVYSDASKLQVLAGTSVFGQCLISGINSAPSWATCASGGAGINYWTNSGGAIYPINNTFDLYVGGTSTASAKFAVLDMAGGTPIASIAAQDGSGKALLLSGNGSIQTMNMKDLTLGGATTGNIILSPDNGSGAIIMNVGGTQLTATGQSLNTTSGTYNLINGSALTVNFAGAATALTMGAASGTTTINNNVLVKGSQLDSNQGVFNLLASPFLLNIGSSSTTASVGGNFVIGASASNTLTVNALLNQALIPTAGGTVNLGSSSNPYNVVYANAFSTPVGNGVQGFWTVTNNTNLYPTNSADDLLIGGTGTGSAAFQIFADPYNNGTSVPAGTATTSGNLTFFGSSTNHTINALNGGSFTFQTSTAGQGDTGLNSVFSIANNGDLSMAAANVNTTASSLNLFNNPTTISLGASATTFNLGAGTGFTQVNNEFRAASNYRLNGFLLTNILPNTGALLSLGSNSNPFNSAFISAVSVPVNSFDGYWKMQNNVLSPQYGSNDLAIGGTATGSATPFQVFANSFVAGLNNYGNILKNIPSGTASMSGDLTFTRQGTTNIRIENGGNLSFWTSVGGEGNNTFSGLGDDQGLPVLSLFYHTTHGGVTPNGSAVLGGNAISNNWSNLNIQGSQQAIHITSGQTDDGSYLDSWGSDDLQLNSGVQYDTVSGLWRIKHNGGALGNFGGIGGLEMVAGYADFYNAPPTVNVGTTYDLSQNTSLEISPYGHIGVGTTKYGNGLFVINQNNSQGLGDIFSASSAGTPVFTITNNGTIRNSVIPTVTDLYNLGSDPAAGGQEWNNLYVRQIITPATGGIAGYWQLNAGVLSPATLTNDLAIGGSATSSALFDVIATGSAAGTITLAPSDPKINNNIGGLPAAQKILNIASTDHSYLSLTNQDLTIGGHKSMVGLTGVQKVFVYDTSKDADGGRWTSDERALASSWYNESRTAADTCVLGTSTRCGTQAFPRKAILVATTNNLYIFDAKDNSLWMQFTGGAHNELTNPAGTNTSMYALNGQIYVTYVNSGTSFGLNIFNFITDTTYSYGNNVVYSSANKGIASRNTSGSGDASQIAFGTNTGIVRTNVQDVSAAVVNGKTYVAVATDGGANGSITLWNASDQTFIANFAANTKSIKVKLTSTGTLYALVGDSSAPTNYALKVKYNIQNITPSLSNNNLTFDVVYAYRSATNFGVTTTDNNTFGSLILYPGPAATTAAQMDVNDMTVTEGTSLADGTSNTVYIAERGVGGSLAVLQENQASPAAGIIKYYNGNFITDDMVGDIRGFWPFNEASGNVSDASVQGNTLTANGSITYGVSGVRGTALGFDGSTAYLTCSQVACGGAGDLGIGGASKHISMGAWVKTSASGARQVIMSKFNLGVSGSYFLSVEATGNAGWTLNGFTTTLTSMQTVNDGNWHYIVGTYDGQNMKIFVDGQMQGIQAKTGNFSTDATPFIIGAYESSSAVAGFFNGTIDEPFVSANTLLPSEVAHNYQVGYRALQLHASRTIRGANIAADASQQLVNGSSNVYGVAPNLRTGQIFIAARGGGLSAIGMDSDTLTDAYSSFSTTKDDSGTAWNSGSDYNFARTVSVGQSFGNGLIIATASNNPGNGNNGGVWMESQDTNLKDFFASSYNPFGADLTQSNLYVDGMFRVTNQLSTRLDNLAADATSSASIDLFQIDNNGYILSRTAANSTSAVKFQDAAANTILNIDTVNDSVGIGTTTPLPQSGLDIEKNANFNAALVVNQLSTQPNVDILTASASGQPEMRLDVGGNFYARKFIDLDNTQNQYYLDPANQGTSLVTAGRAGIGNLSPNAKLEIAWNNQLSLMDGNSPDFISVDDTTGASTYTPIWRVTAQGANEQIGGINTPFGGLGFNENRVAYSEQFTQPAWQDYCGAPTSKADNTTDFQAPDGTYTANKIVSPATLGCGNFANGYLQYVSPTLTLGKAYTVSVWMRGATGTETVDLGINDSNVSSTFTLTQTWKRYTYTTDALTGTNVRGMEIRLRSASATYYIWGAQLEQRNYAGSYIQTISPIVPSPAGFNSSLVVNASGSAIFGGNVGVGTSSAYAKIVLQGNNLGMGSFEQLVGLNAANGQQGEIYRSNNGSNPYLGIESFNIGNTAKTPLAFQEFGGNVGIGTNSPGAQLTVGANLGGTAMSSTFKTNAGALGTTAGNDLNLGSLGGTTTNVSAFGVHLYREGNGSDWTTTAMILGMDVDNTVRAGGAYIDISHNGNVGIKVTSPDADLQVANQAHIGSAGGSYTSPTTSNTNLILYNFGSSNWSGIGSDSGGGMYFTAGTSGVSARMVILPSGGIMIGQTTTDPGAGSVYAAGNIVSNGCIAASNGYNCAGIQFYVNGTGAVSSRFGIGTSGPSVPLHILSCGGSANNLERNGCNSFEYDQSGTGNYQAMYGGTDPGYGANNGRTYIQSVRANVGVARLSLNARGGPVDLDAANGNFDYAEIYHSNQIIKPGELVQISHDDQYNGGIDNGGVVVDASNSAFFDHPENNIGKVIEKTTSAYSPALLGVASTRPAIVINDYTVTVDKGTPVNPNGSYEPPVDLAGRAPVNISTINGPIHYGDPITSSALPGFGMKASKAGFIVGRSMQEFDPANGTTGDIGIIPCPDGTPSNVVCGQVYVYATTTWYDPDIYITDTGTFNITQTSASPSADFTVPHYFDITDAAGNTVSRMGAYLELAVSNLRAGGVSAQEVATNALSVLTDNVTVAGQSLHDYIASVVKEVVGNSSPTSPLAQNGTIAANVLSPLSQDSSISATLTNNQLAIHATASSTSAVVAAIDNSGNATFSGTVNSNQLAVNGDATISGTLHADKIEANSIVGLQAVLSTLSAQNITNVTNIIFATAPATPQVSQGGNSSSSNSGVLSFASQPSLGYVNLASYSGFLAYVPKLEAATAQFDQGIIALGPTSLADTSINGQLSIGANMILADNTLNVLGQDLEIQPLRQGGVDFLAGAVRIGNNGDLTVNGKAVFNKGLYASIISPLAGGDLTVQLGDSTHPTGNFVVNNASGSGVFAVSQVGDIIASGTATISKLNLNPVADAMAVSQTEVIATSSAGTAVVNAYQKEITIDTPFVTTKSLIYITPIADTTGSSNQTPFLLRQVPGQSFTVGVNVPTSTDTKFNWLIIN